MNNIILQKRSDAAGAVPLIGQLLQGAIAINTADGAVFVESVASKIENLLGYAVADGGEITGP